MKRIQKIANAFEPRSQQTTTTLYSPILDGCKINTFHIVLYLVFASGKCVNFYTIFFYLRRNSLEEIDYKKRHIFMITLGGKLIISSAIFSDLYYNIKWFSIFVS